jgi:catechol 2,3-dioxygenase-like lactoylglutathione lyase family enzyme
MKGMRHIAVGVASVARSKRIYQEVLGMYLVWEPGTRNVYLSTGCDNVARHPTPTARYPNAL